MLTNSGFLSRVRYRFRDSVFALQAFNVLRFAAFFLVSVLLVKIPLPVDQIADYEYVLFLSSIVTGWWIHGFLQSYMADAGPLEESEKGALFRNYSRLFALWGSGILLGIASLIEMLATLGILQDPPSDFYYFLFLHFVLQACILIVFYLHQRRRAGGIYLLGLYFFITYTGSFLLLLSTDITLPQVYRWLAGLSLPIVAIWIYLYFKSKPTGGKRTVRIYLPHLSLLMLIQGIGFLSQWTDGFWVQYFYGTDEMFALFRYGGREFPLFIILTTTFSTAIIHEAGTVQGRFRIRSASRRYMYLFLAPAIVLLLTSRFLFAWVYNEEFIPASFIFDLYLLLIIVRVLFPQPILIAHRHFKSLLGISIVELLINLILSFTFYWIWGLLGLILGSFVAHLFEMGAKIYLVYKKLGIRPEAYAPVRLYLGFVLVLVVIFLLKYLIFPEDWLVEMWR